MRGKREKGRKEFEGWGVSYTQQRQYTNTNTVLPTCLPACLLASLCLYGNDGRRFFLYIVYTSFILSTYIGLLCLLCMCVCVSSLRPTVKV